MKKSFILITFSLVFISTLLLVQYKNQHHSSNRIIHLNEPSPKFAKEARTVDNEEEIQYKVNMINPERASVTFIMDSGGKENGMLEAAEKHYRLNPTSGHETLVSQCGSILNMIDYLANNETYNGEPWGNINIVQYSQDWKGIHILTQEERNTSEEIFHAMEQHSFNPLDNSIVDAETTIMIDGMGMGNNEPLLQVIALAFGGQDEERPTIRSSKYISTFDATESESRKYITESFFGFFPGNNVLNDETIISQFQKNYPEEEINWSETLDRTSARFVGDSYTRFSHEDDLQTVCILRPMTIANDEAPYTALPFKADLDDPRFFTTITATLDGHGLQLRPL